MNVRDGEEEKVGGICTSDVTRELVARKMIFPERRHDGKLYDWSSSFHWTFGIVLPLLLSESVRVRRPDDEVEGEVSFLELKYLFEYSRSADQYGSAWGLDFLMRSLASAAVIPSYFIRYATNSVTLRYWTTIIAMWTFADDWKLLRYIWILISNKQQSTLPYLRFFPYQQWLMAFPPANRTDST